jgi:hypothetical protein
MFLMPSTDRGNVRPPPLKAVSSRTVKKLANSTRGIRKKRQRHTGIAPRKQRRRRKHPYEQWFDLLKQQELDVPGSSHRFEYHRETTPQPLLVDVGAQIAPSERSDTWVQTTIKALRYVGADDAGRAIRYVGIACTTTAAVRCVVADTRACE